MDCPTVENRSHPGPRLTQANKIQTLECFRDICEKIYFPSESPFRPADEIIKKTLYDGQLFAFKGIFENGERSKAKALIQLRKYSHGFHMDCTYLLYRFVEMLPFYGTNRLLKLKKMLLGQ